MSAPRYLWGGLVFQALLRNPLAEPYILGISGGSAIGAILGIMIGLPHFPGVTLAAFGGSLTTLVLVTHSLQVAKRADRVLMLDQGRLAPPSEEIAW